MVPRDEFRAELLSVTGNVRDYYGQLLGEKHFDPERIALGAEVLFGLNGCLYSNATDMFGAIVEEARRAGLIPPCVAYDIGARRFDSVHEIPGMFEGLELILAVFNSLKEVDLIEVDDSDTETPKPRWGGYDNPSFRLKYTDCPFEQSYVELAVDILDVLNYHSRPLNFMEILESVDASPRDIPPVLWALEKHDFVKLHITELNSRNIFENASVYSWSLAPRLAEKYVLPS